MNCEGIVETKLLVAEKMTTKTVKTRMNKYAAKNGRNEETKTKNEEARKERREQTRKGKHIEMEIKRKKERKKEKTEKGKRHKNSYWK